MASSDKMIFYVGRMLGWLCLLLLATACWHSNAWASALASVAAATVVFMPAERWPGYTLTKKIALLLLSLVLVVLLHPPADHPTNVSFDLQRALQAKPYAQT